MATQQQLDSFHRFASEQIANGGADMSLSGLVAWWMLKNPSPQEHAANVAAIREAVEAMHAGDRGRPADEVIKEVCAEVGLDFD